MLYFGIIYWWCTITVANIKELHAMYKDEVRSAPVHGCAKTTLTQWRSTQLSLVHCVPVAPATTNWTIQQDFQSLNTTTTLPISPNALIPSHSFDPHAPVDLKFLSLPPRVSLNDPTYNGGYYPSPTRVDTTVHIYDTGLEPTHPDLLHIPIRWIWPGPAPGPFQQTDADQTHFHGTGVVGKVAGSHCGVAKRASIVMVQANRGTELGIETMVDAFARIYEDVKTRGLGKKAVLSISGCCEALQNPEYYRAILFVMRALLKGLTDLRVVCVIAAGNNGKKEIAHLLAVLGAVIPELIVVGGAFLNGTLDPRCQTAFFVKITALSEGVVWPGYDVSGDLRIPAWSIGAGGTSTATASVALQVAIFLSTGVATEQAREFLFTRAYSRAEGGPKVVWNGVDFRTLPDTVTAKSCRR